ncbi:MAG TPA: sugar ABC transporter permease [Fimbriimonadaceae bacterium]|nr:sugar ABC transporter permease [Fimbriimonadaceae bacterium]
MSRTLARRKENAAGFLFASPWLLGIAIFMLYPVGASLYYSFCDYSILKPPMNVGLDNYRELAADAVFWKVSANTLIYAVLSLPTSMLVALGLAMLLNNKVRALPVFRTIFFLPSLVPQVALAVLWLWIFNSEHGIFNTLLDHVGISGPNWLGDPAWTKPCLAVMAMWGCGNMMVIYLASLQDVPATYLEAAELDGAGAWARTRHITLPMISPIIFFNLITGMIGVLQVFTVPYVMFPDGTPARSSYFYTTYLFDNAFKFNKMGYACAMAWIMLISILILTGIAAKLSSKHVYYEGAQ